MESPYCSCTLTRVRPRQSITDFDILTFIPLLRARITQSNPFIRQVTT